MCAPYFIVVHSTNFVFKHIFLEFDISMPEDIAFVRYLWRKDAMGHGQLGYKIIGEINS